MMMDFITEHFYYSSADDERCYFMGNVSESFIPPPVKPLFSGKYRVIDGQLCYIEPILPEDEDHVHSNQHRALYLSSM
jgi:hypothetical protein